MGGRREERIVVPHCSLATSLWAARAVTPHHGTAHQQMESEAKSRHSQAVRRKNSGNEGSTGRRQSEDDEHHVSINSHRNEENIPHSSIVLIIPFK